MAGTFRYQAGADYPLAGPGTADLTNNAGDVTFSQIADTANTSISVFVLDYRQYMLQVDGGTGYGSAILDTATSGVFFDWSGQSLDVRFSGAAAGDVFQGGSGDDYFDGHGGADTVLFSGNRADYTISYEETWVIVTDNRSGHPDGTDRVFDIETLKFGDDVVTLSPEAALSGSAIVVTTLADIINVYDGKISLREALIYANAHMGADTITFDAGIAGGTITLLADMPLILGDETTIDGGANDIVIDGDDTFRGFFIGDAGLNGNGATRATIANLTIANTIAHGGDVTGGGGGGAGLGGAIFVSSTGALTLTNVHLSDNAVTGGDVQGTGASGGGGMGGDSTALGGNFLSGGGGFGQSATGGTLGDVGAGTFTGGASGGAGYAIFDNPGGANGGGGGAGYAIAFRDDSGGAGGGVGGQDGEYGAPFNGGNGGFGGGGGSSLTGSGGAGGFGGGGGVGGAGGGGGFGGGGAGLTSGGGAGGFGGGDGSTGQGGGGAGMGGGIFVMGGGSLKITGTSSMTGNSATGGTAPLNAGSGLGSGIFIHGNTAVTFAPGAGETLTIADSIADQNGNGGSALSNGIGGTGGSGSIVKTGAGTLVLSGSNTFAGTTTVTAGTLTIDGSNANSAVTVKDGAVLGGKGTTGAITIESGGTLGPGNSPGIIHSAGLSLTGGATLEMEIAGPTVGTQYDQVNVTGTVSLGGATLDLAFLDGYFAPNGSSFILIANDGTDAVDGTFAGLAEGAVIVRGAETFSITYRGGTGNDVVLTALNDAPTIAIQGKLDVAATNSAILSVLLGTGTGAFGTATGVPTGAGPFAVALGDVDGDGTLDAIVANTNDDTLAVLRGDGRGGFAAAEIYTFSTNDPVDVVLGDVNGDVHLDIVKTNIGSSVDVLINDGAGHFTAGTPLAAGARSNQSQLADLDGDGHLDVLTINNDDGTMSVRLGLGDGTFGSRVDVTLSDDPEALAVGDINGDGNIDVAITTHYDDTLIVRLGDGAGGFGPETVFAGHSGFGVALGDFNEDGHLDVVTPGASGGIAVRLGDGTGGFGSATVYGTGGHRATTAGDVNGDGHLDIVASSGGTLKVFLGDGTGSFDTPASFNLGTGMITWPALGDLDNARVTDEDEAIVFNAANGNAITLDDDDLTGSDLRLSLTVDHGRLELASTAGLGTIIIAAYGDSHAVTIVGSLAAIKDAINGLKYTPLGEYSGRDRLTIKFDDSTSVGGKTANAIVPIIVEAVNDAPTLSLTPIVTTLKESASTASDRKVADITVSDIDGGTNVLSLAGADKGLFVIKNGDLYLKAGAKLDFETNPKLDVTVRVDDATISRSPDDSVSFQIKLTDVVETINGNNAANTLKGGDGAETIDGKGGHDRISGGRGGDTIIGGAGGDTMTGGAGPDVFRFKPGDLPTVGFLDRFLSPTSGKYDLITDFKPGTDTIDLKAIDADRTLTGNQKFHFEGEGRLTGSKGELVYQLYGTKPAARHTIILGDTDGDGGYDFRIVLKGHHHLDASDFIL